MIFISKIYALAAPAPRIPDRVYPSWSRAPPRRRLPESMSSLNEVHTHLSARDSRTAKMADGLGCCFDPVVKLGSNSVLEQPSNIAAERGHLNQEHDRRPSGPWDNFVTV